VLDSVRRGCLGEAFETLHGGEVPVPKAIHEWGIIPYSENPALFKSELKAAAEHLAALGL
jgi:hypothetical protein